MRVSRKSLIEQGFILFKGVDPFTAEFYKVTFETKDGDQSYIVTAATFDKAHRTRHTQIEEWRQAGDLWDVKTTYYVLNQYQSMASVYVIEHTCGSEDLEAMLSGAIEDYLKNVLPGDRRAMWKERGFSLDDAAWEIKRTHLFDHCIVSINKAVPFQAPVIIDNAETNYAERCLP